MVLVKGTFVARVQTQELDYRYLFLISPDDLELMSMPSVRAYDPRMNHRPLEPQAFQRLSSEEGSRLADGLLSGTAAESVRKHVDALAHRGFVVRVPFFGEMPKRDPNAPPIPGMLPRMGDDGDAVGREFWIMLRGPWRTTEKHTHEEYQNAETSLYHGLGIYPVLDTDALVEERGRLDDMPWHLHSNPGMESLGDEMMRFLVVQPRHTQQLLLDTWWRTWGAALSMPLATGVRDTGQRLYQRGVSAPRLEELYRCYARTCVRGDRLFNEGSAWELPLPHGEREHSPEQPMQATILDMSNPEEYGAPGTLFPVAMLDNPYAFVGPAACRGVSTAKEGSGIQSRFPFWVCDLLAQSVYGQDTVTDSRARAVVYDAVRNLELRSRHAFVERTSDGLPRQAKYGEGNFDFDSRGPSPAGSTVFERDVMDRAIQRRVQDIEGVIEQNLVKPRRITYLTGTEVTNPYITMAGFLGTELRPLPALHARESRWETACDVVAPVRTPDPKGGVEIRYGLNERVRAARHAFQIAIQQRLEIPAQGGDENPAVESRYVAGPFQRHVLPFEPALRETDPRWRETQPPRGRMLCTNSQAAAMDMFARWRISVVTGDAGCGKSAILREVCRAGIELSPYCGNEGRVILLVLTMSNIAMVRVIEELQKQTNDITLLGHTVGEVEPEGDDLFAQAQNATCIVGTVDSYLRKLQHDQKFVEALRANQIVLVLEEAHTISTEGFVDLLEPFREHTGDTYDPDDWFYLDPQLIRIVLVGDEMQVRPIEPGDLLPDMMSVLPVTRLTEQRRYSEDLAELFAGFRLSMQDAEARRRTAQVLVETSERKPDPLATSRVILVDDLPPIDQLPHLNSSYWLDFRLALEERVRQAVFKELLAWSRVELSPQSRTVGYPRFPDGGDSQAERDAASDYILWSKAMLKPIHPFIIITMVRTPFSSVPRFDMRAHYISSSDRVNGWFHDVATHRLWPMDPEYRTPPRLPHQTRIERGDDKIRYFHADAVYTNDDKYRIEEYGTLYDEIARTSAHNNRRLLHQFLSDYRPRTLVLSPDWPYIVTTNDFRSFGIMKGERVYYKQSRRAGGNRNAKSLNVFESEGGRKSMAVPNQYCTRKYLRYGWATNVHQVMGAQFPLVIVIWMDALSPSRMMNEWDRIRPQREGRRAIPNLEPVPLGPGSSRYPALDDMLDLHALYTAVTRTHTRPETTTNVEGRLVTQSGRGRCVLIAGKHALRRYVSLESIPRFTAQDGILYETMVAGAQ